MSGNSKVVVIGNSKNGLPLILGGEKWAAGFLIPVKFLAGQRCKAAERAETLSFH